MPWLEGASLVSTLGPKQVGRHEFPLDLAALGGPVVTDSVAQVRAYDPPFVLAEALDDRLLSLGDAVTAGLPEPGRPGRPAVFFSVGLAGTEAFLLHGVLSEADSGG
jgi:ornithine cyclodeaminase